MNLNELEKLVENQKLDVNKPFCDECLVNLIERREPNDKGYNVYLECPTCRKQWIFECNRAGDVISIKTSR